MTRYQAILAAILGGAAAAVIGIYLVSIQPKTTPPTETNVNLNINLPVNDNEPVVERTPVNPNSQITVTSPQPNESVASPLTITGQARGSWYFEASFPVKLVDANGNILDQQPAQAQGEWMTTEFVPFEVTLTFARPATSTGTLILEKDNPSGLPENDNRLEIPISFNDSAPVAKGSCKISGCSGEICSDQEMVSACIYKDEFACYKSATCEKQNDGRCGWTETLSLTSCVANAK